MTPRFRSTLLALAALALVGGLAPSAPAASTEDETFVVRSIERVDNRLSVTVTSANFPVILVTASLLSEGALAATPEITRSAWGVGETVTLNFTLLKSLDQVTLRFHYTRGGGASYEESILLLVPDATAPTAGQVGVVDAAVWRNLTLNFTLRNSGEHAVGRVVASVEDRSGVKIATPYQREVARLGPGERVNVSFEVSRATPDVTVVLQYGGRAEETKLYLRSSNATSGGDGGSTPPKSGNVTLGTDLPFRDSEPGKTIDYNLQVANDGPGRLVEFRVDGLPAGYSTRFYVNGNGVPSVFIPAEQSRDVRLEIQVPATASDLVGQSLGFRAVAASGGADVAALDLSLTLRGKGRLELEGDNWFAALGPGETREVNVTIRNSGTAPLHDVSVVTSKPAGWQVLSDPTRIARLDAGQSVVVTLKVRAPEDVGTGKYVIDVKAQNYEAAARVRTVSVDVATPESSNLGWILAASFAGLVALVIVIKVKRK